MQAKPYCCSMPITIAPAPMPANTMHHLDTCRRRPSLNTSLYHPQIPNVYTFLHRAMSLRLHHNVLVCAEQALHLKSEDAHLALHGGLVGIVQDGDDG